MSDHAERSATAQANGRIDRLTGWFDRLLPFGQLRPLQRIPSLKVKLSILIVAAVGVTIAAGTVGFWLNVRPRFSVAVAVLLALAMVQILARGITTPVREIADAADRMAGGHYDQQVSADGADEIGQLARSFNLMAAHIAELEHQHRDLIANVSHELRTPLAVLQGSLENLIDGVEADRPATLEAMVRQTARLSRLVERRPATQLPTSAIADDRDPQASDRRRHRFGSLASGYARRPRRGHIGRRRRQRWTQRC